MGYMANWTPRSCESCPTELSAGFRGRWCVPCRKDRVAARSRESSRRLYWQQRT